MCCSAGDGFIADHFTRTRSRAEFETGSSSKRALQILNVCHLKIKNLMLSLYLGS